MATFFTSDTHYGHRNICAGTTEWTDLSKCRPYATVEEMNTALVDVINSKVGTEDVLWHLGDWSFGGYHNIAEFRERINCLYVHLVMGNHDHWFVKRRFDLMGLFESINPPYCELVVDKQPIVLCHYALRVWNNQAKGAWHMHGHSHGNLPRIANKSIDVGVDARGMTELCGPWSMDDLRVAFALDNVPPEDHHDGSEAAPPLRAER